MSYYSRQTCGRMIDAVFGQFAGDLLLQAEDSKRSAPAAAHSGLSMEDSNAGSDDQNGDSSNGTTGMETRVTCCYSARAAVSILEFLIELIAKSPTTMATTAASKEQVQAERATLTVLGPCWVPAACEHQAALRVFLGLVYVLQQV